MSKLHEDFPGFAALDAAGEATEAKIRKRIAAGTLTEIDGIGPGAEAKIIDAFEELDSPANQAKDLNDDDDGEPGKAGQAEGNAPSREESKNAVTNVDRDGSGDPGPGDANTKSDVAPEVASVDRDGSGKGADARTEEELRDQAKSPELKRAVDENFGVKLAHSRLCFYDDPEGPFVADADTVIKRNERIKVMPISMVTPKKGIEVYDGDDHYALTEDMGVTNFGEPGDWLKVRSPNTGLALIR